MSRGLSTVWPPMVSAFILLLLWENSVRLFGIPPYVLPAPSGVFTYLISDADTLHILALATLQTGGAALFGFVLATVIGVSLGTVLARFGVLRRGVYPLANLLQMVPIIALAPLLNIWFGYGIWGVSASACIVAIFPVIANTVDGLRSVDPRLRELFHLYGAPAGRRWWLLELPAALPQIFTGLRVAAGLSVIGAVVGELVSGILDDPPIGALIASGLRNSQLELVFSAIFLSALVGFALFGLVSLSSNAVIGTWHASGRATAADQDSAPGERRAIILGGVMMGLLTGWAFIAPPAPDNNPTQPIAASQDKTSAPDAIRVQLNWVPEPEFGGIYAAEKYGYFAAENLAVQIIKGGPGVASPQLTATGAVEFGVVSGDQLVTLRAKGAPLVGVYACFDQFPRGIVTHAVGAPSSLEALWKSERTIAVEPGHAFVKWLNHSYGGEDLRLVPSQGGLAQFKRDQGLAQAVFIFAEPVTLRQENIPTKIFSVADSGYNPYSVLVATNEQYLKANPDVVRRFVRALRRGWETYLKEPAATNVDLDKLNPAMNLEAMNIAAEIATPYVQGGGQRLGEMTRVRWQTLIDQLHTVGAIKKTLTAEDCFHNPE
jgi:ABC-type nitrate/sulfonate/bicarbonate transport system permease component/ABC-type nitrate/sulfonate/bicarbonate transport system substrate-binding protein